MTREYALKTLDTIPTIGDQVDALEMAISALENEDVVIDQVLLIIDEISDSTCITFGTMTYSDGKGELRNRVLALKGVQG